MHEIDFLISNNLSITKKKNDRTFEITFSPEHSLIGRQDLIGAAQTHALLRKMTPDLTRMIGIPLRLNKGAVLMPENLHFSMIDCIFLLHDNETVLNNLKQYYCSILSKLTVPPLNTRHRSIPMIERVKSMEPLRHLRCIKKGDFENAALNVYEQKRMYIGRESNIDASFEIVGIFNRIENGEIIINDVWMLYDFYCSGHLPEYRIPVKKLAEILPSEELKYKLNLLNRS